MIQKILTKYILAIHVAVTVIYTIRCFADSRMSAFLALLWFALLIAELMVLLPSVRKGETLADARIRVVRAIGWDPFFYSASAFVGVLFVQWRNSGCKLDYLADAGVWQMSKPLLAWAPFSVEPQAALKMFSVFAAGGVIGIVMRNAVGKAAKRMLLQWLAGVSGGVACFAVARLLLGDQTCSAVAQGKSFLPMGAFFGFWMTVGFGVYAEAAGRGQRGCGWLLLFGVLANLVGTLFYASPVAILCYVGVAVVLCFYGVCYLRLYLAKQTLFKLVVGMVLTITSVVVAVFFMFPGNSILVKILSVWPIGEYYQAFAVAQKVRTTGAWQIWQEHPWVGCGTDGFYHFVGLTVSAKDWALLKLNQGYVNNDCLQFLCEYGVLGAGLLLMSVIVLLVPVFYRAHVAWKYGAHDENDGRFYLMRVSPIVVAGVLATVFCFVESWFASPFRVPGVLMSWICVMTAMPSFLPVRA